MVGPSGVIVVHGFELRVLQQAVLAVFAADARFVPADVVALPEFTDGPVAGRFPLRSIYVQTCRCV